VQAYDVGDGIGQVIFGALDSGGLEEIGNDEDEYVEETEEQNLSNNGESNSCMIFCFEC